MKLGIISDAHGHVEAFRIAWSILRRRGAERVIFLGDAVGYLPGADVVEELMLLADVEAICGNHEVMLLSKDIPSERDEVYGLARTSAGMRPKQFEYLASWPRRREMATASGPVLLVHGSPADETFGYVYPQTELAQFEVERGTTVFMGHTHHPFIRREAGVTFVNVGSCGLPRDCGHLGAACLFDDVAGEVEILRFDIASATERALRRCGSVHPSVREVFARRPTEPVAGVVVDG